MFKPLQDVLGTLKHVYQKLVPSINLLGHWLPAPWRATGAKRLYATGVDIRAPLAPESRHGALVDSRVAGKSGSTTAWGARRRLETAHWTSGCLLGP